MGTKSEDLFILTQGLKEAISQAVQDFIAEAGIPVDSFVSLNMSKKVAEDDHEEDDFDAFCDTISAIKVMISL